MKSLPEVGDILIHEVLGKGQVVKVRRGVVTFISKTTTQTRKNDFQWCVAGEHFRRAPFINPWLLALRQLRRMVDKMPCECWQAKGKNVILVAPCTREVILKCRNAAEAKLLTALHRTAYSLVTTSQVASDIAARGLKKLRRSP